jgi:hypothetical protein
LCFLLALLLSVTQKPSATAVLAFMVALGFLATYLIQGKFFFYHVFPAALFAAIGVWVMICERLHAFSGRPFGLAVLITIGVYALPILEICVLFIMGFNDRRPVMSDLSWAEGLNHPRALAISPYEDTAFPLARRIGAVWVDRTHSQWVARYTRFALRSPELAEQERSKFLYYHKQDLDWILRQITEKEPDIIIEDVRPENSWLTSELIALKPGFLDGYRALAEEGGITVLCRKDEGKKLSNSSGSAALHGTDRLAQPH